MKYDEFRRSGNVEDYTDPKKPVPKIIFTPDVTLREASQLMQSDLAKQAGADDINKTKGN